MVEKNRSYFLFKLGVAPTKIPFRSDVKIGNGPRLYLSDEIKDTTAKLATQKFRDGVTISRW